MDEGLAPRQEDTMHAQTKAVETRTETQQKTGFQAPRRLFQPRTFDAAIDARFEDDTDVLPFDGIGVGPAGLFVVSDYLFESGEVLNLTFEMPSGRRVEATARVADVSHGEKGPAGMRLEFTDIAKPDWSALYEYATHS